MACALGGAVVTDTQSTVYIPDITQMPVGVPATATGAQLFFGTGAPTGSTGADGAYYIDTSALVLYGPRTQGVWEAGSSFRGADAGVLALTAGAQIAQHASLIFSVGGQAILADPTVQGYVWAGLAHDAATTGASVTAIRSGLVTDPSWTWTPGAPLFAAPAGALSSAPPTSGAYHKLGNAITATTILLAPEPVINIS